MKNGFRSSISTRFVVLAMFCAVNVLPHMAWCAPPADSTRVVVMVSIDGLAAFYMDDSKAEMPTIRALAETGAWARMKSSAPTVTWPNHTNLVTGVTTAQHGVVGNEYFDRTQKKIVPLILDPEFDKDEIVRVPTIYDVAHAAGLKTAAVRWPASRNAKSLDWTVPEVGSNEQLHKYTTPELLTECQSEGIWADGELVQPGKRDLHITSDDTCAQVFNHILRRRRPNLALLHLIDVDHMEHVHGPRSKEAYEAINQADLRVREIWEILKKEYPGNATLIVVSDHGFSPIEHVILPNVALRDAGLVLAEGDQAVGGSVRVVIQGGAAMVYVLDQDDPSDTLERLRAIFHDIPGIAKIAGPGQLKEHGVAEPTVDPHAPDMLLFAEEGYSFGDKASGNSAVIDDSPIKGTHGHDEHMPNMHASFFAWGAGIKAGARPELINNTDVAPTIAKLLGVPFGHASGRPIAAALAD